MSLFFKKIDNHLQRQLLKLMYQVNYEPEIKQAIYLGYGVIRSHLIDIIEKIRDYYKYHDKLSYLYSIEDMFIPGKTPSFIIPSLSDDVYTTLKDEIKEYLNGFDKILAVDSSNYYILNDLYSFKEFFSKSCYNSIYYALKEIGLDNFPSGAIEILNDSLNKEFFGKKIGVLDLDSIFDFKRNNVFLFGWDNYYNNYSIAHKEYKKLKKMMKEDAYLYEDENHYEGYDGIETLDGTFKKYLTDALIEQKQITDITNDLLENNIDDIEKNVETITEKVKRRSAKKKNVKVEKKSEKVKKNGKKDVKKK